FRSMIQRVARDLAPLSLSLVTLALVGIGFRLADQWHRHEGPELGFTHIHVLVGAHQHHDDDGPSQPHREPAAPSEDSRSCGVLALALSAVAAPEPRAVARPTAVLVEHRVDHLLPTAGALLDYDPSIPRAPPV
ncbi:MAG: hypothetical protein WBN79_09660, partial [Gemmatimonadota bacterium]